MLRTSLNEMLWLLPVRGGGGGGGDPVRGAGMGCCIWFAVLSRKGEVWLRTLLVPNKVGDL